MDRKNPTITRDSSESIYHSINKTPAPRNQPFDLMSKFLKKNTNCLTFSSAFGAIVGLLWLGFAPASASGTTPVDSDMDGMDDSWEMSHFKGFSHDGTADSDGDGLSDLMEYQIGLNPNNGDTSGDGLADWAGVPGHLSRELWLGIPGASMADLTNSLSITGVAGNVTYLRGSDIVKNLANDYAMRVRGRVTAPVSGLFRFTLEGKSSQGFSQENPNVGHSMELWLGDNEAGTSRRRVIASPGPRLNPTFDSGWVRLEQGREYFLEILMKAGLGTDLLKLKWEYQGQALQLIPEAYLRSWIPDAGDTDGDGMSDVWEQRLVDAGVGDVNGDGQVNIHDVRWDGDFDGNGIGNGLEYRWGLDGTAGAIGLHGRIGRMGYLSLEIWRGIPGSSVSDLTGSAAFAGPADAILFPAVSRTPDNYGDNYGARMRGRVIAPVTGNYVFTLASQRDGTQSMELWLGTKGSETSRQLVAAPAAPGGLTTPLTSGPIHLVAGQEYYIEVLMKAGAGADGMDLLWEYPGQNACARALCFL